MVSRVLFPLSALLSRKCWPVVWLVSRALRSKVENPVILGYEAVVRIPVNQSGFNGMSEHCSSGWWFDTYFCDFHPELGGRFQPILTCAYFSTGLVQPPTETIWLRP